jgi:hypothetical protein
VCGEVLVALLVTGILGDEVEVFAADDEGTCFKSTSAKIYAANSPKSICNDPEP